MVKTIQVGVFDWSETNKANYWIVKKRENGYKIYEIDTGGDTYLFFAVKNGVLIKSDLPNYIPSAEAEKYKFKLFNGLIKDNSFGGVF